MARRRGARLRFYQSRSSLTFIIGFLVVSALIRVGSEAGQVLARESSLESMANEQSDPVAQSCAPPADFAALMDVFREREDRIVTREEEIQIRAQALSVTDAAITKKLGQLEAAEENLRSLIALAETAAEDDVSKLTEVYESMKPKDAAALFEQMDPEFAAGFLSRMQPEAAAGVMAGLTPQAAYTISVVLAGRNASVPTN